MQDPATMAWLVHLDMPLPNTAPPGRNLAPLEIARVLDNMKNIRVSYRVSNNAWEAAILSRLDVSWASLAVKSYSGDLEEAHAFCFPAGWDEIILQVASQLAKLSGPLVLLPNSGDKPQVVY
jgi:hypothetical protein